MNYQIDHKKTVDIIDKVLDPEYWCIMGERVQYTGHMYRNSPYESDDSCSNCNGARCDICKKITIGSDLEFCIQCDKLEKILLETGIPKDIAKFFTYDDSGRMRYKGYYLIWPSAQMLKDKYPEKYKEIYSVLEEKERKEKEEIQSRLGRTNNVKEN